MSVDPIGNLENSPEPKKRKAAVAKVRKHLVTTAYKSEIAERLDKLYAAGHTVLSITASTDVRGFEVISYTEE